jgi:Uma2 family endonuclease
MTIQVSRRLFTTSEYERMVEAGILGEDERLELLDGEVREMSPIGSRHVACVNRLNTLLNLHMRGQAIVSIQNPIRLSDYSEPEPDIAILHARDDYYADALPVADDVLMIVEVADTSLAYDREDKLPRYAAALIAEVWIIDLEHDTVERYVRPLHDRYAEAATFQRGETLTTQLITPLAISITDILGSSGP